MMQPEFRDSLDQAFTDMFGSSNSRLSEIATMESKGNFLRATFISSLNAVMRYLRLTIKTIHCRNDEPKVCGQELVRHIEEKYGHPKIAMIGLQPRIVEALSEGFELKVTDVDQASISTDKFGCTICGPRMAAENPEWCDVTLVTGTTLSRCRHRGPLYVKGCNCTMTWIVADQLVLFVR